MHCGSVDETWRTISDMTAEHQITYIDLKKVMARTAKGKTSIYQEIKAGTFPAPVKHGRLSRWIEHEIDEWCAQQALSHRGVASEIRPRRRQSTPQSRLSGQPIAA